jgi:hypothetical protein
MNERLKELAVQAGATVHKAMHGEAISFLENDLERFADLVRQDERRVYVRSFMELQHAAVEETKLEEREACAALCEEASLYFIDDQASASYAADYCAEEIRKRGNHGQD